MDNKLRKVQYSLKQNCKLRIKGLFEDLQRANKGVSSYLLITDANSLKILSSFMKMMELMELNILAVERIDNDRKAYPKQHVIYFLSCQSESIELLLKDFSNKKDAKYGQVHLFFINRVSNEYMSKIASNSFLLDRVVTFKEFNQDFACKFDNIFNLEIKDDLSLMYSSKMARFQQFAKEIGDKLATVILSFEKIYGIEIMHNKSELDFSQTIAHSVHQRLNEVVNKLQGEKSEQLDSTAGKITLVIVDRAYDPLSPILHDFYYQPMLYDLLESQIENDIITYKIQDEKSNKLVDKKAQLNEQDDLFKRYRFSHIAEVMSGIGDEFSKFVNSNSTAKMQMGAFEELDFKKMSEIIRSMPQYQELIAKYNMHMKIIEDCWNMFELKDLKMVGELEQSLATGLDVNGDKTKEKQLVSQISARLQSDALDEYDKLRLVLIATMTIELTDKHRKDLTQYLPMNKQIALDNLTQLGINPQRAGDKKSKSKTRISKEAQKKSKHKLQQQTFDLCRTTPELENLMEQFISDFRSTQNFKIPPNFKSLKINCEEYSGKGAKALQQKNRLANILGGNNDDDEVNNGIQKIILFVAGGIAYNEIRAVRNLIGSQDQDFLTILGGTSFITPKQYVDGILNLKSQII
ncbi:hypothetical protein ABPG72_006897 [Tetrahymena utriculariae]